MRFKKEPIKNEALKEAMHKFLSERTVANQNEMLDLLVSGEYWVPAKVMPAPIKTSKGEYIITPGHKVNMITAYHKSGVVDVAFYLVFTDAEAYKAWAGNKRYDIFTSDFDELAVMILRPSATCNGIIINPETDSVCLDTDAVREAIVRRDSKNSEA